MSVLQPVNQFCNTSKTASKMEATKRRNAANTVFESNAIVNFHSPTKRRHNCGCCIRHNFYILSINYILLYISFYNMSINPMILCGVLCSFLSVHSKTSYRSFNSTIGGHFSLIIKRPAECYRISVRKPFR